MTITETTRALSDEERKSLGRIAHGGMIAKLLDRMTGFRREVYVADFEGNTARVFTLAARRVREFRENRSEGPKLVIEVGDAECVGLFGSWLFDPCVAVDIDYAFEPGEPGPGFPADLRIAAAPRTGHVLLLESLSSRRIEPEPPFQEKLYGIVAPVERIPVGLDGVVKYFSAKGQIE